MEEKNIQIYNWGTFTKYSFFFVLQVMEQSAQDKKNCPDKTEREWRKWEQKQEERRVRAI